MNGIDKAKFVLFILGLASAVASSLTSSYFLYSSMLGKQTVVYECNILLAFVEMVFLVLAVGTCIVASEIYYEYLELKGSKLEKG